ncbi:hypothetical protein MNV49_001302 [Pseudohyphozyma bogoriensis]|nr:hypothetical protein MNV49_001302 [Pseudohyphozyma bogoriensis]
MTEPEVPPPSTSRTSLLALLSLSPSSSLYSSILASLSSTPDAPPTPSTISSYPDSVYYNYHALGLSIQLSPTPGSTYKPPRLASASRADLEEDQLGVTQVDVYNHDEGAKEAAGAKEGKKPKPSPFAAFPAFPVSLPIPSLSTTTTSSSTTSSSATSPSTAFPLTPKTTGKDLVLALGEPSRKGGGAGSMGIWCEWVVKNDAKGESVGVMVEFASAGLQAWDKGGESVWRVVSLFAVEEGGGQ